MSTRIDTPIPNVEVAYQMIARDVMGFLADRAWEEAGAIYEIHPQSIGTSWWRKVDGKIDDKGSIFPSRQIRNSANDAVRFLHDDLLKSTGSRIWGLTFTLHPDGRFNIEYDYNKPNGYEDVDAA